MFLFTTNDFIFSKIHLFLDFYGKMEKKVCVESLRIVLFRREGDDYLKNLYKELEKNDAATVDRDLLQRLFLKHIDENSKK